MPVNMNIQIELQLEDIKVFNVDHPLMFGDS